jgi:hypothetical protein
MRRDYQQALDLYETSKAQLRASETSEDVRKLGKVLDDGRFHLACVLARRDGEPLPQRREPCFFNPQHGPAVADLAWTPPGGVEREVQVCRRDRDRLTAGEEPDVRLVRVGDRYVPWWQASGPLQRDGLVAHVHDGHGSLSRQHAAEATTRSTLGQAGSGGGMFGP